MIDINPSHKIFIAQKALVLNSEGKILILRRTKTAPSRPLGWDIPGGSLAFGEDPKEGMLREIKEETGILVSNVKPIDVIHFLDDDVYTLMIGYTAISQTDHVNLSFEHDEYKWISKEEFLNENIPATFKEFLQFVS